MNISDVFWWLLDAWGYLADSREHFTWAFLVGCLVYQLTWTTSCVFLAAWESGRQKRASLDVVYTTGISCLLPSYSWALITHWVLDRLHYYYNKPWYPPLELNVPEVNAFLLHLAEIVTNVFT